ncbi:unnamed protein product [Sphagnum jensenii]|uniref:Histone deacetylase domain-containing protein n=1 Tax=Sphagnum jensenii TaxID=128206 RepID=A0ABP0VDV8_9BRYO
MEPIHGLRALPAESICLSPSPYTVRETPLHLAAATKNSVVWNLLAVTHGVDPQDAKDRYGRTPHDVCVSLSWQPHINDTIDHIQTPDRTDNKASKHADALTAIVYHPLCSEHITCSEHEIENNVAPPENPKRLKVLIDEKDGILQSTTISKSLHWAVSEAVSISDVLRVHEWSYIRHIQHSCALLHDEKAVQLGHLDGDTAVSNYSFMAALHAAGAVCQAVDLVLHGSVRNAFCPIRPPDVHHGNGTEETVKYLRPTVHTSTLLDNSCFGDLHVPTYKPWYDESDPHNVLFVSVHGFGAREIGLEHLMPRSAFYPGSGKTLLPDISALENAAFLPSSRNGKNTVEHSCAENEIDEDDNDDNDKGNGNEDNKNENDDDDDDDDDDEDDSDFNGEDNDDSNENEEEEAEAYGNDQNLFQHHTISVELLKALYESDHKLKTATVHNDEKMSPPLILDIGIPLPTEDESGGLAYRKDIFPRLMKFKPDLIFISAGFDAHKKDTINSGIYHCKVNEVISKNTLKNEERKHVAPPTTNADIPASSELSVDATSSSKRRRKEVSSYKLFSNQSMILYQVNYSELDKEIRSQLEL